MKYLGVLSFPFVVTLVSRSNSLLIPITAELHHNSSGRKWESGGTRRHREGRKRNKKAEKRDSRKAR